MYLYAEILLISRDYDNWLSRLSNDTLKIIADYFLIPDCEEFKQNEAKWYEMSKVLDEYITAYEHEIEYADVKENETFEEMWQRAFNPDSWLKYDDNECQLADIGDCLCEEERYEARCNLQYWKLKATYFVVCDYAHAIWMNKVEEEYKPAKKCLEKYYDEYEITDESENSQDSEESNSSG